MGGYANPADAEASSPYASPTAAPTAAQADYRNVVGRQNREDRGLAPTSGVVQGYQEVQQQQQQQDQQNQQTQQRNQERQNLAVQTALMMDRYRASGFTGMLSGQQTYDRIMGYEQAPVQERTYLERLEERPRYTPQNMLGDTETQRRVSAGEDPGRVLESQRKYAESTPGTRDDQFYLNELSKWNANAIERSSEYHHETYNTGVQQKANPYENRGDVALAFEKGGNLRDFAPDRYGFNQNVQEEINRLPGGQGLQETAWGVAKSGQPSNVDFSPAIDYQIAQEGRYGPYGSLYGGVVDKPIEPPMGSTPASREPIGNARLAWGGNQQVQQSTPTGKDWNPFVASAAEPIGYIGEGIQLGQSSKPAEPSSFYEGVSNWVRDAPVLGYFYEGGSLFASAHPEEVSRIQQNVQVAPIFESIYKGGGVFELKSDMEREVTERSKIVDPMLDKYNNDLSIYNTNLKSFNTNVTAYKGVQSEYQPGVDLFNADVIAYQGKVEKYNMAPTQEGYDRLTAEKSSLDARKQNLTMQQGIVDTQYSNVLGEEARLLSQQKLLETQKSNIDIQVSAISGAQKRYDIAASNLVGNVEQSKLLTYGAGKWIEGGGDWYQKTVLTPTETTLGGYGPTGQFIVGVIGIPKVVTTIGQSTLVGGETLVRNAKDIPGVASAGVAMQMKGTYEQAVTNPAGLAGTLVGMYVIGAGVKAVGGRAMGYARTRGQEYVPIEDIGYTAEGRYPLNPVQSESALTRSFAEGRLYPSPTSMAEPYGIARTTNVPYLHGENGVPVARLPNAQPGETTLWTALESSSRARGINVGEAYRLETSGGSEVQGLYGAPIAESFFAKVGGKIPQMIGIKLPRTPTIYSTITEGLEAIPRNLRESLTRDATGRVTPEGWNMVNEYIQTRSAEVPAGQGYMPMLKAEYEAIIPDNSIIEVTGRNYYTRLGGWGDSHFLGTRVPIVEQISRGFLPGDTATTVPTQNLGSSYSPTPAVNLIYLPPAASAVVAVSALPQRGIVASGVSRTNLGNTGGSILSPKETSAYQFRSNNYGGRSSANLGSSDSSLKSSAITPSISYPISPYKSSYPSSPAPYSPSYTSPYTPQFPVAYSPDYSKITSPTTPSYIPPYSPTSPGYTPPHTPSYTPPYSPASPSGPGLPGLPGPIPFLPGGGGGYGTKRRGRRFRELFPLGIDLQVYNYNKQKKPRARPKKGRLLPAKRSKK